MPRPCQACAPHKLTGSASGVELPCGAPPAAVRMEEATGDSLISRSLSSRLRAARSLLCSCRISEAIVGRSKGHGPGCPNPKGGDIGDSGGGCIARAPTQQWLGAQWAGLPSCSESAIIALSLQEGTYAAQSYRPNRAGVAARLRH
eukprot:scaffold37008_cov56-Phaeocystis_antarctica.AAC.4